MPSGCGFLAVVCGQSLQRFRYSEWALSWEAVAQPLAWVGFLTVGIATLNMFVTARVTPAASNARVSLTKLHPT